jgi:hypothetical protein
MEPSESTIFVGETIHFSATGFDQFGDTIAATVTWTTSGGGTVDTDGLFTATAAGDFTVTATDNNVSATAVVHIAETLVLTHLSITPDSAVVYVGNELDFNAFGTDQHGDSMVVNCIWSVSDGGTVDSNGIYLANTIGNYTITATDGLISANAELSVIEAPVLTQLTLEPSNISITIGDTVVFIAHAIDQYGNTIEANKTWTVSGGGTINGSGIFNSNSAGVYTVTVSADALSVTGTVTIYEPYAGISVPGTIEAEEFISMYGVTKPISTICYVDAADWLEYKISVKNNDTYRFEFLISSNSSDGICQFSIDGDSIGILTIPNTTDTTLYQSVFTAMNLPQGTHQFRISSLSGAFNFDRMVVSIPEELPVINFLAPSDHSILTEGEKIRVQVDASHSSGIEKVELYLNNILVRNDSIAPYEWGLEGQNDLPLAQMAIGTYELRAVATSRSGLTKAAVITVEAVADTLLFNEVAFSAPVQVKAAEKYSIGVDYSSTASNEVKMSFLTADMAPIVEITQTVARGKGTIIFELTIPSNTANGSEYVWQCLLTPMESANNESLANAIQTNVQVINDTVDNISTDFYQKAPTIFPVPFSDILYFDGANRYSLIKVFDISGQLVKSVQIQEAPNNNIDLSILKQGVYYIQFSDKAGFVTQKAIKY